MTTPLEVSGWRAELDRLPARFGRLFARSEPRQQAGRYLEGLLGPVERKNGWQPAEHLGDARPWRTQRVLSHVLWDEEAARDLRREYTVERLGGEGAVLIIDETGFVKKGRHSAGVARQCCGTLGKVENCQVGVFLAYGSRRGHALIERRLHLPEAWAGDAERRRAAKVPEDVPFLTKPAIAREMLARALDAGVPCDWVLGDEVDGADRRLRLMLEERGRPYVLAIRSNDGLGSELEGRAGRHEPAVLARALPPRAWRRLSAGAGTKGERLFDWARGRLPRGAITSTPGSTGCRSGARSRTPRTWRTSSCSLRRGRGCSTWRERRGDAGWWRSASRPPSRRWARRTTRCGAGTGTSRSPCWRSPS
jgi:SRSO17 transposase